MQTNTSIHLQDYNEKDVLFTSSQSNFLSQLVGLSDPPLQIISIYIVIIA